MSFICMRRKKIIFLLTALHSTFLRNRDTSYYLSSARSRPWDTAGGGSSILLEKGGGDGRSPKKFFSALRASFSSKKYGGGGPPLDPPLLSYTTQDSNSCEGSSFGFIHCFSSPNSIICSNVCPLTNYTVDAFCTKINDNRTCIVIWTSFLDDLSLACTLVFMQIANISRDI